MRFGGVTTVVMGPRVIAGTKISLSDFNSAISSTVDEVHAVAPRMTRWLNRQPIITYNEQPDWHKSTQIRLGRCSLLGTRTQRHPCLAVVHISEVFLRLPSVQ
jgi:hypothetical protein